MARSSSVDEVYAVQRFGVSRTPIRQALHRLETERLLVASGRSLIVYEPSTQELHQIYGLRILLEGEAAAQAAEEHSAADLTILDGFCLRDAALENPSAVTRMQTNRDFHQQIWRAAKNPVLQEMLTSLSVYLGQTARTTLASDERWQEALGEHRALVAAIRQGDGAQARKLAENHLERAEEVRLKMQEH